MSTPLERQVTHLTELLQSAGGTPVQVEERLGTADAWLLRRGSALLLLKRGRPEQDEADVAWEHAHLL